jgi:hypothetical protein
MSGPAPDAYGTDVAQHRVQQGSVVLVISEATLMVCSLADPCWERVKIARTLPFVEMYY